MAKPFIGYQISRGYTKLTLFEFNNGALKQLLGVETLTPSRKKSRRERYNTIAKRMTEVFGFSPSYKPTKKGM